MREAEVLLSPTPSAEPSPLPIEGRRCDTVMIKVEEEPDPPKEDDVDAVVDEDGLHLKPLPKSASHASITSRIRRRREQLKNNRCAGITILLVLGALFNGAAYLVSVYSASLNREIIQSAVQNEHTIQFKLKKVLAEAPSQWLIGLLNFVGRVLSAIGTVMLIQVVASSLKRRRSSWLRGAAGHAEDGVEELHGGLTEALGEFATSCLVCLSSPVNSLQTFG